MSDFHVEIVRVGPVTPHPNADTLDLAQVYGYTVVVKRGQFAEGELSVYLPIEALVPDTEEWHWLCPRDAEGKARYPVGAVPMRYRVIEPKRLRGVFSQGLLAKPLLAAEHWVEGKDVREELQIERYDLSKLEPAGKGECESPPKHFVFPVYTDIEPLKRHPDVLREGEQVVITEKIHGANARYVHDGERLWVGSHNQVRREPVAEVDRLDWWWAVAYKYKLRETLAKHPHLVIFGEVYGQVQDLKYGVRQGVDFRVFDVFSLQKQEYLDIWDAHRIAVSLGLTWAPILYVGKWDETLMTLSEGRSVLGSSVFGGHVREGFVVRPEMERYRYSAMGRVILKQAGEGYLMRRRNK